MVRSGGSTAYKNIHLEQREECRTAKGLSSVLGNKFKPQHNKIIISLWYCKLHRKSNESSQEWIGRLQTKAAECVYNEYDRLLREQFIGGFNDKDMIEENLREVVTSEVIEDATSEWLLIWAKRVEAQSA